MYYNVSDLPASTRVLPYQGKRIFMKFYNRSYEKYQNDVTASIIAWEAVKRKYIKVDDEWIPRCDANEYDTTTTEEEGDDTDTDDTE